jgi:hypothetical protein
MEPLPKQAPQSLQVPWGGVGAVGGMGTEGFCGCDAAAISVP